jgi:hypothetical protein
MTCPGIVDVDVHPVPRSADEIRSHLPMPWRDRYAGERQAFFNTGVSLRRHRRSTPGRRSPRRDRRLSVQDDLVLLRL